MKRQTRRRTPKLRQSPAALEHLHPNAAGIDCGAAEHFVAVPPDRAHTPVQSFPTFTADLHRLADWLTASRVTHVAMEATGVYWIPIFEILDARGFQVILLAKLLRRRFQLTGGHSEESSKRRAERGAVP